MKAMFPLLLLSLLALPSCGRACGRLGPGDEDTCKVPGQPKRLFDITLPADWDGTSPLPVILALHGGGGNREAAAKVTCPGGDLDDPRCLVAVGTAHGYAVVRPDGTAGSLDLRTWNAGGGTGDWQCVSGTACKTAVDDLQYFDDLMSRLESLIPVESYYVTGLSNGGAMTYRLACDRADRLSAIAPVGTGNQAGVVPGCSPSRPVPTLHIHGTGDTCWRYETSAEACLQQDGGKKVGVEETLYGSENLTGWREHLGCQASTQRAEIPDASDDGLTSYELDFVGCAAPLRLIVVEGGGHVYPGGSQYLKAEKIGPVTTDYSAAETVVAFFDEIRASEAR